MKPPIDPKLIVFASIIVPVIYVFFELKFTVWSLIILGAAGLYFFDKEFTPNSEVEIRTVPQLGPEQPFMSATKGWEVGLDGTPYTTYQPPIPSQQKIIRR